MLRKNNKRMPDVLDCLANLSNDEVFTPPEIANRMLDLLPQEVFESKETTFLDPFTKSGVFLREITKRLLSHQIPNYEEMSGEIDEIEKTAIQEAVKSGNLDLQDADYDEKAKKIGRDAISTNPRVGEFHEFEEKLQKELNRILKTQVFGIAITELTAQLTRRSLYCSKNAAGKYSIGTEFNNEDGNIRFKSCQHVWDKKPKWIELDKKWKGGTCIFCGASSEMFDRPNDLEQHAYEFIHTPNAERIFDMKFDVICGNPPYQLQTAESGQAKPIYNKFVEQAKRLNPKYLTMIIPSRWMMGGIGLDGFRQEMINDKHIKELHDFEDAGMCFPNVHIDSGVCYFLRDSSFNGLTQYTYHTTSGEVIVHARSLHNAHTKTVIRDYRLISILDKIKQVDKTTFSTIVSPLCPYKIATDYFNSPENYSKWITAKTPIPDAYHVFGVSGHKGGAKRTDGYLAKSSVGILPEAKRYKIFFSATYSTNAINPPEIILASPDDICTATFLSIGGFDNANERDNCSAYMKTMFFRALLYCRKGTIHVTRDVFEFIPLQDFSKPWTDEELYAKYNLTQDEIDFIESMMKPAQ